MAHLLSNWPGSVWLVGFYNCAALDQLYILSVQHLCRQSHWRDSRIESPSRLAICFYYRKSCRWLFHRGISPSVLTCQHQFFTGTEFPQDGERRLVKLPWTDPTWSEYIRSWSSVSQLDGHRWEPIDLLGRNISGLTHLSRLVAYVIRWTCNVCIASSLRQHDLLSGGEIRNGQRTLDAYLSCTGNHLPYQTGEP